MPLRVAILASGSGSNAQAIFDKIAAGLLDVEVCLVLCNRPGAKVLERAKVFGVPTLELDHTSYPSREDFDAKLVEEIKASGAELIVLAGYMRVLTPVFLDAFENKVINVHPAILPSFTGAHGARDACAWGVQVSGCTVHFVDEEVDHGAVIAQAVVPVLADDDEASLQKRIQSMEYRIYPQVLQWFAENRVQVEQRRVCILPAQKTFASTSKDMTNAGAYFVWPPLEEGF